MCETVIQLDNLQLALTTIIPTIAILALTVAARAWNRDFPPTFTIDRRA